MIALLIGAAMLAADTSHFVNCDSLPRTRDSTAATVYGIVSDPFTKLSLPLGFVAVVADVVRTHLRVSADLPMVVFDRRGWPTVVTTAAFSLMPGGDVRNVAVMASSTSMVLDSMLIRGLEAAARDSSYPPLPPGAGSGIRLALRLSTDSTAGAVPMLSVRLPLWPGFVPAQPLPNRNHPQPIQTALRGESDTLELAFIVGQSGAPLLGTANLLRSPQRAIALDYLDWLGTSRYVPAHIGRCAVRSLVHLKGTLTTEDQFVPAF
jgi:hypothetical protein